ncbi:hypothetical protein [Brevibacillus laterosporus]|nr:hypothetical protein [Brevibacillus laterosporus]MED1666388.1 hypothetical protein [Brevibacillus laterosporus]MED1671716.1 hypothetical protein [Brevibacillus laterosporus]MED1720735.1 hypothetical protein [Brevibacillus laterosporus]
MKKISGILVFSLAMIIALGITTNVETGSAKELISLKRAQSYFVDPGH